MTHQHLSQFSKKGLRTLAIAFKDLTEDEYKVPQTFSLSYGQWAYKLRRYDNHTYAQTHVCIYVTLKLIHAPAKLQLLELIGQGIIYPKNLYACNKHKHTHAHLREYTLSFFASFSHAAAFKQTLSAEYAQACNSMGNRDAEKEAIAIKWEKNLYLIGCTAVRIPPPMMLCIVSTDACAPFLFFFSRFLFLF